MNDSGGTMITFYQVEWCPSCHRVRQTLTELGLDYTIVNVAASPDERAELMAVADQQSVPVLVDGDRIYGDAGEILDYLRATYTAPDDARAHAAKGAWRSSHAVSLPPRAALAQLKHLLEERGFRIVSQTKGAKISDRLPKEYTLLLVTVPVAAVKALDVDPLAPGAVAFPIAVVPTDGGTTVIAAADPVGQVWLFGEGELIKTLGAVKKRLHEALAEL